VADARRERTVPPQKKVSQKKPPRKTETTAAQHLKCHWWARQDSNLGPMDYESTALTAELRAR
jgi:hypothetical protein